MAPEPHRPWRALIPQWLMHVSVCRSERYAGEQLTVFVDHFHDLVRDVVAIARSILEHARNSALHLKYRFVKVVELHSFLVGDPSLVIADVEEKAGHTHQRINSRKRFQINRSGSC